MSELKSKESTRYTRYENFFSTGAYPVTPDYVGDILEKLQRDVVRPLKLISAQNAKVLGQAAEEACVAIGAVTTTTNILPKNR